MPMHALAIETSGRTGSVAIVRDGTVVAERDYPHGLQHAAALVPIVDDLVRSLGLAPRDLAETYVSAGPGSFTGLRVGITLAKTLAFATGAKVVAVPTVRVLAENAPADAREVIVVLDAKRGQIFTARFAREVVPATPSPAAWQEPRPPERATRTPGGPSAWREVEPARLDTLAAMLARAGRPVHLLGEGIDHHRAAIPADDPSVIATEASTWVAKASVVARLGKAMARDGAFVDPFRLTPIYIRLAEAEEKRLAAEAAARGTHGNDVDVGR